MKKFNCNYLILFAIILLFTPAIGNTSTWAVGASYGSIWAHPEAMVNNYVNSSSIYLSVNLDKFIKENKYISFSASVVTYPFTNKKYDALPAVVGAGRLGENGDRSYQYNLELLLMYKEHQTKMPQLMSFKFYWGLGIGVALYHQGERRWKGYNSMDNDWFDIVQVEGWKPVTPTVIGSFGLNLFQSKRLILSAGIISRLRFSKMNIEDYAQTVLNFGQSINAVYTFYVDH